MSLNKAVEAMQQTPIFSGIDPKRLRLLAFMSESLTYREGELLFDQGDEGDSAFVVPNIGWALFERTWSLLGLENTLLELALE